MCKDVAYQVELENREQLVQELTEKLEKVNKKIAKLRLEKEGMEGQLIAAIGHDYEGSKSYDVGCYSVTVKTDMIYALDKKAYADGHVYIPCEWDPVTEKVSYEVNKKLFNEYEANSPAHVREALSELVTKKPSKPNVSIKVKA